MLLRPDNKAWQSFRELCVPKWSEAFVKAVTDATGVDQFTYVLAVVRINGDKSIWERRQSFSEVIGGNPLRIITFEEMVTEIYQNLGTTLAATEVGRMLQMFRVARIGIQRT